MQTHAQVQAMATPLRASLGDVGDEFHKKNRKRNAAAAAVSAAASLPTHAVRV